MTYSPVVSRTELATIARCPNCKNARFFIISRFMQVDDFAELDRLKLSGFKAESGPLCQLQRVGFCECRVEDVKKTAVVTAQVRRSGLGILSLKNRVSL